MLQQLTINNIALIAQAQLTFAAGLSVVTGETGAGKSMFIGALGLIMGQRADFKLIRKGEKQARVEAIFNLPSTHKIWDLCDTYALPREGNELIIQRVLTADNSSKALINGARVTVQQLAEVGQYLGDIHGQHEQQLLFSPAKHALIVDECAGAMPVRKSVEESYHTLVMQRKKLAECEAQQAQYAHDKELFEAYVHELEQLDYQPDEEDKLADKKQTLLHIQKQQQALAAVTHILDDMTPPSAVLAKIERELTSLPVQSAALSALTERVISLSTECQECEYDITQLSHTCEAGEDNLETVDDRLNTIRDMARKHRTTPKELPQTLQHYMEKLAAMRTVDETHKALKQRLAVAEKTYNKTCSQLTAARTQIIPKLEEAVAGELHHLKLPQLRFKVHLKPVADAGLSPNGAEHIQFMVAPNPGADYMPLQQVVSGGEASRLMLALKVIFFHNMPAMTVVFDEIDTGIGGAVADAVGEALATLGEKHQVFTITHQPQVAAKGTTHIKLVKSFEKNQTTTAIHTLNDIERHEELARMLAGKEVTNEAKSAAASLLKKSA